MTAHLQQVYGTLWKTLLYALLPSAFLFSFPSGLLAPFPYRATPHPWLDGCVLRDHVLRPGEELISIPASVPKPWALVMGHHFLDEGVLPVHVHPVDKLALLPGCLF